MRTKANGLPIWLIPHILSLDAPLVALAWQALLALHTGLPLRAPGRVVLALTVWLIYVADRLLDVRALAQAPPTARHRFYFDHQPFALGLVAAIATVDAAIIGFNLRPEVFRTGLIPSGCVAGYLVLVHRTRFRVPKELLVAFLFTAGTFVVASTNARDPIRELWLPGITFFVLCLANLILIERWEAAELRSAGEPRHWITDTLCRTYPVWLAGLAVACAIQVNSPWYRSVAMSAAGLLALLAVGERWRLDVRRALSDVVLLTPVFFLL
jgi:hypothetical protein